MSEATGGEVLAAFVDEELVAERARRAQLGQRGAGIITTSSGLATLLFAASALVTGVDAYTPPTPALWALAVTFLGFAVAAFCGLMTARQRASDVVHFNQLEVWRSDDKYWANTPDNVKRMVAKAKIMSLAGLRSSNDASATWAERGFFAQLVALGGLVVAVGTVLAGAIY